MAEQNTKPEPGVVIRDIVCPDGTQFAVYADGTWAQSAWDGSPIRDSEDWLRTYYEPEGQTDQTRDEVRREVLAKLGL